MRKLRICNYLDLTLFPKSMNENRAGITGKRCSISTGLLISTFEKIILYFSSLYKGFPAESCSTVKLFGGRFFFFFLFPNNMPRAIFLSFLFQKEHVEFIICITLYIQINQIHFQGPSYKRSQ